MTCLNCDCESFRVRKGYCDKCYPFILKIKNAKTGILPEILNSIKKDEYYSFEDSRKEYIRQLENRLIIIRDSNNIKNHVSPHDLEFRINFTLRKLHIGSLDKFNDSIAFYLKDDLSRGYIYELFSKIQLLRRFKIDYYRIYEAGYKNKKQNQFMKK